MPESILASSRVLVTGATGFLGSHLCERLRACGAEVHGVSRSEQPAEVGGMRWWRADLGNAADVERIFRLVRPEVVYHLAGHVTAAPEIAHVLPAFASLLASTVHVLMHATEHGVRRVVLIGSLTEPREPSEVPGSPYAAAKSCASVYARMFRELYGTPVVALRVLMAYGPRQSEDKVIPTVVGSLLRGEVPRLSSGDLAADWIYVDDVVGGLLGASTAPNAVGEEIDLGTGKLTSVREVVERIVEIMRPAVKPVFGALPDRPHEQVRAADVESASIRLGWQATTPLAQGLERTIAWHRQRLEDAVS